MAKTKPMYLLALEISNMKCFGGNQRLVLSDSNNKPAHWTVILGDNGVGKTSLLHALTWMRPAQVYQKKPSSSGVRLKAILDDMQFNEGYESLLPKGRDVDLIIRATFQLGIQLSNTRNIKAKKFTIGVKVSHKDGKLKDVHLNKPKLDDFYEPNLFAYAATRHMVSGNVASSDLLDPVYNLMSSSGDLYDADEVLNNLHHKSLMEKSAKLAKGDTRKRFAGELLERIKKVLVDILPSATNIVIKGPKIVGGLDSESGVHVQMPSGLIPLRSLSLGYQTMLAWAVDLAIRMFENKPDSINPLEEPAIVIVDEIDLHLHPKWQREIRDYLVFHFPNTQFIVTAHSPLVAQSAEYDNLAVVRLEGKNSYIDNVTKPKKGQRVDQILGSDLFEIPHVRSKRVQQLIDERRALLDNKRTSPAQTKRLQFIDSELSELPTEETDLAQRALALILKKSPI